MARKSAHPDRQLFEYLGGRLDEAESRQIKEHLSDCPDCASVAGIISEISNLKFEISDEHPDISQLATLFYARASTPLVKATAAHVAVCESCASDLAEYARADKAASLYKPSQGAQIAVPRAAWDLILDWEQSSFARPRPQAEAISKELLLKLSALLSERKDQLLHKEGATGRADLVPVIIVDKTGQVRGVEMFERATDTAGQSVLKHAGESARFDNKPFHALLDFGEKNRVVVSDLVRRDTVRIERSTQTDAGLRRADYFIIED